MNNRLLLSLAVLAAAVAASHAASGRPVMAALEQAGSLAASAPQAAAAAQAGQASADQATQLVQLNAAIVELLKPFNNNLTKAALVFNRVETNAQRALHVDLAMDYRKKGPDGDASILIPKLSYDYPVGGLPRTQAQISLGFNLLNLIPQEQINQMGPAADQIVAEFAKDYLRQYGAAATIDARVTRKDVDAQGNLTAIAATLGLKVDLSRLPADAAKQVMFTDVAITLQVTLKGGEAALMLTSNPNSEYFQRDQDGLKETLEKLLARDPQQMREIRSMITFFDRFAESLTRKSPSRPY